MKFLLSVLMVAVLVAGLVTPGLAGDEKKPGAASAPGSSVEKGASEKGAGGAKPQGEGAASPATGEKEKAAPSAAPAQPASKDDCKDDGWKKFGFKNQGECVSSVAPEKKQ